MNSQEYILQLLEGNQKNLLAFSLAFLASCGTFIGGILVVLITRFSLTNKSTEILMGILQAFSAGVMVYITCFDLVPESIEHLGSFQTMIWFFGGVLAFGILEFYIIPDDHAPSTEASPKSPKGSRRITRSKKAENTKTAKDRLLRTSFITFLALALHNLPEGLGVYLSTLSSTRLGLQLACGILLHNIPEGMAVAIPLYAATHSYSQVLFWTLLNGLAEPFGVIIGGTLLHPYINHDLLHRCLALVGGIMMCISIHELFPMAIKFSGRDNSSVFFFVGMVSCFGALESVSVWLSGHGHGHVH